MVLCIVIYFLNNFYTRFQMQKLIKFLNKFFKDQSFQKLDGCLLYLTHFQKLKISTSNINLSFVIYYNENVKTHTLQGSMQLFN